MRLTGYPREALAAQQYIWHFDQKQARICQKRMNVLLEKEYLEYRHQTHQLNRTGVVFARCLEVRMLGRKKMYMLVKQ